MKRVAMLQSNYIPWKGYFDIIAMVDEFILYDHTQYTRRDWRNRNQIKTPQGIQWLSVPVRVKGKYLQKINETEIDGVGWQQAHWKTLASNYAKAPCFKEIAEWLEPLYVTETYTQLCQLNQKLIQAICNYLGITTKLSNCTDYVLTAGKTERLLNLCIQAGASEYVTGPAAKSYIDENQFKQAGITVLWINYDDYPPYPQQWGDFVHGVTILDLLFNCGKNAYRHMKYLTPR